MLEAQVKIMWPGARESSPSLESEKGKKQSFQNDCSPTDPLILAL